METASQNLPAALPTPLNGHALALAPESNSLPMPVQVSQIINRVKAVKEIVSGVFVKGDHFGEIPGTAKNKDGSAKMVLLKPGFDALCLAFQFAPEFIKQPESVESDKFINIIYKCRLIHTPTGRVIATGDGSCNSKEEKYRWTTSARTCPICKGEFIRTSKPEDKQGFYCWKKLGGCGATFPKVCPEIDSQPEGRKENDNPWNFHNTLTKMAQKRAGMAAIITACGLSSDFTQDMEDFEPTANAKGARGEDGIDIQTSRGPYDGEQPKGENRSCDVHDDRPPQAWRDELEGASAHVEDAQYTAAPAAPAVPLDIQKAMDEVTLELRYCKTKEQFQRLVGLMRTQGGPMKDARVTAIFNQAYYAAFPKTTPAPAGA
jgi:hypothetical protein